MELAYLPAFTGGSRYRLEFRGSLSQKIALDFNLSLRPYYSFDSRPPNADLRREDFGLVSSVGWIF